MNTMKGFNKLVLCLMIQLSSVLAIASLNCTLTETTNAGPHYPGNSSVLSLLCVHGKTSNQTAKDLTVTIYLPRVLVYKTYASSKSPSNFVNSTALTIEFQSLEASEKIDVNLTVDIDPFRISRQGYLYKVVIPYEVAYRTNSSTCKEKTTTVAQAALTFYSPKCSGFTALGMESGAIKESQLSASSIKLDSNGHMLSPSLARLKHNTYWTVANYQNSVNNNFIQIDFRKVVAIEEMVTQGSMSEHVTSFRIEHSKDGITWTEYRQDARTKIFKANSPTNQMAEHPLWFPIATRYLRIFPTKWQKEIRFRVEFYGCVKQDILQDDQSLGMEAGQILSNQISSSSNLVGTQSSAGRLNYPGQGWCAATQDELQYLQIDLLTDHVIKAVSVQSGGCTFGSSCPLNTVESFYLANSTDGTIWDMYKENGADKLFLGALQSQPTKHTLIQAITTRLVRFKPKTFRTKICMRTEIYGQDASRANGDELPFFSRSFMLLPDDNILIMCNAENKRMRCFLTRGASRHWLGFPLGVRSLLGYDTVNDTLYAVGMKRSMVFQVRNIRSTNISLKTYFVPRASWEEVKGLVSTIWATEVPSVPITDSSSDQPSETLLKQATNGDTWGASSQGIHYKPSGGATFILAAYWRTRKFDGCLSSPCSNGGTCVRNASSVGKYSCVCKHGWRGSSCNTAIKACESSPCQNNGACIDTVHGFSCNCTDDWTGEFCTIYQNPAWFCEGTWKANTKTCYCDVKDYWGRHCQKAALYRLVNGLNTYEGRVELFYNNQWGTVCDDSWNLNAAKVLCKSLGYPAATAAHGTAYYGQGTGPMILDDVNCLGNETRLGECSMKEPLNSNCAHSEDAGAECIPKYRLANGSKLNEGRFEVFYLGSWGTVCDRGWSNDAGLVACKSLGYSSLISSFLGGHFPRGDNSSQVVFDNVVCTGSEAELSSCKHSGWGISTCSHQRDVGVKCKPGMRLVGGTTAKEGRVEIFYRNKWGTVCDDHWTLTEGNVICRSLGYQHASSVTIQASFGAGTGTIWLDNVHCSGSEASIEECQHQGWGINNCGHTEDAGVVCS
ncbi:uncharacterized protein LOC116300545 [Actinia tenebrosa]|uniref:Uncharacterized protein LOC116300545 n=1 Tax=Actinia tenebrosa TaxID=6105 RepID=A0A6P8IAT3_ACTTE|nr:uncharacterized protein LOC116300545 [Actinia tenebrosa]